MHLWRFLCAGLLASLPSIIQAKKYNKAKDAILLSNVRTLTLQKDKLTTGRRSSPVQQLSCIGGNAKGRYDVDVMRCKNSGSEYDPEDIQWTCQASLPPEFKLGSTDVICEGYDSPEDQHVLKGSCGVEYRLILTEAGEEKFAKSRRSEGSNAGDGLGKLWTYIFWIIFIVVVIIIIAGAFDAGGQALGGAARRWGGFGGGGGGDNDDPPPPYTPRSQPRTSKRGPSHSASTQSTNSGPGFWSGAGLGGAAGYAAGNYMGSRSERSRQERQQYTAPGPSNYGRGSSWFGGGGGSGGSGAGPSRPSTSSSSMPSSSSNYESTGFGGTRRR